MYFKAFYLLQCINFFHMLNSEYNSSFFLFFFLCIHLSNVEKTKQKQTIPIRDLCPENMVKINIFV